MSERKNIDKLFQDKFKDLGITPSEDLWNSIEEKLKEKKEKKRVIPFWWRLSGVAAILVIGLSIYNYSFTNGKISNENGIVNEGDKPSNDTNTKPGVINIKPEKLPSGENGVASENKENSGSKVDANGSNNTQIVSTEKDNPSATDGVSNQNKSIKNNSKSVIKTQNEAIASSDKNGKNRKSKSANSSYNFIKEENKVAENRNKSNNKLHSISKETFGKNNNNLPKKENPIAENNNNSLKNKAVNSENKTINSNPISNKIDSENKIANTNLPDNKNSIAENNNTSLKTNTNSVDTKTVIENKLDQVKKTDSTKLANVEPNALEELLKEKEKKNSKEGQKSNRWQLTPNVAPIYFSSVSNGSPLDSKLNSNTKEYSTNYSYGLGVNYNLNKKISLRTGVNVFTVAYNTNGVSFEQNTNASKMQNIDPTVQGSLIQIEPINNNGGTTVFSRMVEDKFEGTINQKFGYIEMPVEVSYKIINKKFGLEVIGGMSTLFLNQNEVFLKATGMNMKIGEANNLNNVHFSGNLGLGIKYGFLKRLEAHLEPVFKYQISTFNNDVGGFKPYVFGVYSGISYTF